MVNNFINATVLQSKPIQISINANAPVLQPKPIQVSVNTNVVVLQPKPIQVSVNASVGGFISNQPIFLKNNPVLTAIVNAGPTSINQLTGIDTTQEANGDTLVYNSANNTFTVEPLDASFLANTIDLGTF
jgi:hypothetical protein